MDITGLGPIVVILGINLLISLVVFIWTFFQEKDRRSTIVMLSWFLLIVPLVGLVFILSSRFLLFLKRGKNVDMSDVSFSQEREKLILPPDRETEMNYVPIEDAMAVSDTSSLRRLVLDTLRNNAKKTLSYIKVAMNSNDTEVSHYAASIIMDALSEYRSTSQNMIEQMQKNPEDVEMNLLVLEYIYDVLSLKIMNDIEQRSYIYILDNVAENLFTNNLWYMTATHYLWLTDMFISIKDYEMADKWVTRAGIYRPNMLDTYKANLHFYFEKQNYSAFFECLNELSNTDIVVDEEILNLFRLYNSGN